MARVLLNASGVALDPYWLDALEAAAIPSYVNYIFAVIVILIGSCAIIGNRILVYVYCTYSFSYGH